MADDSETIQESFEFHPCDIPKGVLYYNLEELTEQQQTKLNSHKVDAIKNNHIYLKEHPEVKLITTTLLQGVLKARPKYDIQKFFVKHLIESWPELKKAVNEITTERALKASLEKERLSALDYLNTLYEEEEVEEEKEESEEESESFEICTYEEEEELSVEHICEDILEEIIQNLDFHLQKDKHHVHIQVEQSGENDSVLDIPGYINFDLDG